MYVKRSGRSVMRTKKPSKSDSHLGPSADTARATNNVHRGSTRALTSMGFAGWSTAFHSASKVQFKSTEPSQLNSMNVEWRCRHVQYSCVYLQIPSHATTRNRNIPNLSLSIGGSDGRTGQLYIAIGKSVEMTNIWDRDEKFSFTCWHKLAYLSVVAGARWNPFEWDNRKFAMPALY